MLNLRDLDNCNNGKASCGLKACLLLVYSNFGQQVLVNDINWKISISFFGQWFQYFPASLEFFQVFLLILSCLLSSMWAFFFFYPFLIKGWMWWYRTAFFSCMGVEMARRDVWYRGRGFSLFIWVCGWSCVCVCLCQCLLGWLLLGEGEVGCLWDLPLRVIEKCDLENVCPVEHESYLHSDGGMLSCSSPGPWQGELCIGC